MKKIFSFGEKKEGFSVRILNEREAVAGAGILFLFAMISFFNAFLIENYTPIKIFVTFFMLDFIIRVLINPKYSPTLILGRIMVSNQKVEYTGAPQKRFAWALALIISIVMFFLVAVGDIRGVQNLVICLICLTLMFFEVAFGICIGCKMYNIITKKKAQLCPGGVCELRIKEEIQKVSKWQVGILVSFLIAVLVTIISVI